MTFSPVAARALLAVGLVPFLYFAGRDQFLHLTARRVPLIENLLHLAIGIALAISIMFAFRFDFRSFAFSAPAFIILGAIDEFVFHRKIPETESDAHAKEHFALLAFFVIAVCMSELTV